MGGDSLAGSRAVVVHRDAVNSASGIVFALREVLGFEPEFARSIAADVHLRGRRRLVTLETVEQAEGLVAELQLRGLHATLEDT